MSFEQPFNTSLAAALGDDNLLVSELLEVFLDSAGRHFGAMSNAPDDASWSEAALRLKGLAASFGATGLMEQAARAAAGGRRDPELLGSIERSLAVLAL